MLQNDSATTGKKYLQKTLNSYIIDLDALVLLAVVPEIPPVKLDLINYDNEVLEGVKPGRLV